MDGTAYQSTVLAGTRAQGPVVRVEPQVFAGLVGRSPTGLVVAAEGRALRANQYLMAYRGLWFTTSSRAPLELPRSIEVIRVKTLALSV
ncbi:MAG: hypothetical protein WC876_05025 [Candidatus Thermoplasmatota archaeon]